MAFVESDATHPSAMSAEVVWKATASEYDSGKDKDDFEVVEGVSLAKGMVRKPCWNFGWCWVSPPLALFAPSLPSYLPFGACVFGVRCNVCARCWCSFTYPNPKPKQI